jgi:transposase
MSDTFSKVEVITGVARRRRFSTDLKLAVVAETMQPGMSISYVARRHGLSPSLVFRWRRLMSEGGREAIRADDEVVPAAELRRLEGKRRSQATAGSWGVAGYAQGIRSSRRVWGWPLTILVMTSAR